MIRKNIDKIGKYHLATTSQANEGENGTSIYVHEKVAYDAIQTNLTELQVTALKIYINNNTQIDIYNIYNHPKCKYDLKKIKKPNKK